MTCCTLRVKLLHRRRRRAGIRRLTYRVAKSRCSVVTPPEIYRDRDRDLLRRREGDRDIVRPRERDRDISGGEDGSPGSNLDRLGVGDRVAEL